jgi:hypothetical protein
MAAQVAELSASQNRERQAAGTSATHAIEQVSANLQSLSAVVDNVKAAQQVNVELAHKAAEASEEAMSALR